MIYDLLLCFSALVYLSVSSVLSVADFEGASYSTNLIANNFVSINLMLDQIQGFYNSTTFQNYMLNFNLNGDLNNNLAFTLQMPKGWFYDCATIPAANCTTQLKNNLTFFEVLGEFVWNCANQPFWTIGLNNEKMDFTDFSLRMELFNFFFSYIYVYTHRVRYQINFMSQADLAVANGMRTGNFTPSDFLNEAAIYGMTFFGPQIKAPGLSEQAGPQWLTIMPAFYASVFLGTFTFEPTIFPNISDATISNLLSDNYTKGYFKRRFTVNSSLEYTYFTNPVSLQRVRLVLNDGIDGITNTFAAAVWWIDFLMEAALRNIIQVSIQSCFRANCYQSLFGPAPNFTPTSLYYGSMLAVLAMEGTPRIVKPIISTGTSGNVKVWGLDSAYKKKYLILNKEINPLLSGEVTIKVIADVKTTLSCTYMQAAHLNSKADEMTIGGLSYIGGNPIPQGSYAKINYNYDESIEGFSIRLNHAQVALCEMPNTNLVIPTQTCSQLQYQQTISMLLMAVICIQFLL